MSHFSTGSDYDVTFHKFAPRNFHWILEQRLIKNWLYSTHVDEPILDIATGTGRVSGYLAYGLGFKNVIGIDNSESMLKVARDKYPLVRFENLDIRSQKILNQEYKVITAFRLVGKADMHLLEDVFNFINLNTKKDSLLILNNHNNSQSMTARARRILNRQILDTRHDNEIIERLSKINFRIVESFSLGITPQTGDKYYLGKKLSELIEGMNYKYFAKFHKLGVNNIILCIKL
jgi:SAM-dependent methyltransferase